MIHKSMNTKDPKKTGCIKVKQNLMDDARKKLNKIPKWNSLPHITKVLLCKELGLNASDY